MTLGIAVAIVFLAFKYRRGSKADRAKRVAEVPSCWKPLGSASRSC